MDTVDQATVISVYSGKRGKCYRGESSMSTEDHQVRTAVKNAAEQAMRRWGDGWSLLSEHQRRAAVCEAAMHAFASLGIHAATEYAAWRMISVSKAIMAADYT